MALGATLKVRMDTSDVSRGLSGMKSKVGRAFGAIKKVGLAAFGAIAAAAAGLTAAAVSATNFVRSVEMMGLQTGMTTKEVLDLQHAFALVRIDADGAADVMSEFQKRLAEASKGQGEALLGLEALNISLSELKGMGTMEAFERILTAVTDESLHTRDALMALDKMFGSRGFELLRLARNYREIMASARRETEGLGSQFEDTSKFQSFERSMAKASLLAREIQMRLVCALPLEKIEEALDKVDLEKFFDRLGVEFDEFMKAPEAKFIEWGVVMGRAIGEGIIKGAMEFLMSADGIKTLAETFTTPGIVLRNLKGRAEVDRDRAERRTPAEEREHRSKIRFNWPLFNKIFGGGANASPADGNQTASLTQDLLREAQESNTLLRRIEDSAPSFA